MSQDCRRFLSSRVSSRASGLIIEIMSEMPLRKHRSNEIQKIMAPSVKVAIIDPTIHGQWLSVGQFTEHLCAKDPNGDAINFDSNLLVRHLNTVFPRSSLDANVVKTLERNKNEGDDSST